ncbi:di-trans,poly-cis-decaprenylcistransferase [Candidatus Beckwithbacteria bacterium]|nr:di-trans,poly-cis-decaprenylcistransferase [Candidatus Beckwithbacteria bacterium]
MNYPKHIAFIVDGNRRWAQKQGLPVIAGHKFVANQKIDELIFHCLNLGIPYLTFWAFSTENWKRGQDFANAIFTILKELTQRNADKYNQAGIKLQTIGDLSKIPTDLVKAINEKAQASAQNTKLTVTIALNYGGRDEIVRAIKKMIKSGKYDQSNIENLTEEDFVQFLDTASVPDPDLIIRTGGEQRLSGFLSWQNQYSELSFTQTLMPDLTTQELDQILADYSQRERRRGA